MGAYEYTALDAAGKTRKGTLEGDSPGHVRQLLREQGLAPLTVGEVRRRRAGGGGRGGVSRTDLALATRQLATLTGAGIPLEEALVTLSEQTDSRRLRGILLAVRSRVLEGHSLGDALGGFPGLFSDLYRETVAAGEHTGQLDQVLERLASHLEDSHRLNQSVRLAMLYPLIVMIFALGVSVALITYVVPQVTQVFEDFDQELPLITRGLIALSDLLHEHGLLLLLGVVGLGAGIRLLLAREGVKRVWHRVLLRLPVAARLVRGLDTARFARTFGILTRSGVPVLEGLRIAGRVVDNRPMREAVARAAQRVREGGSLHATLAESRVFSPMVVNLIASGEAGGNLDHMLERAAEAQEREVETLVKVLAGILEPLLILLMGGLVLTIVVAILLPIFDLNRLIH
ncbi:MAG: type II secretion system inner membrane protein GspF [Magnetococcales bacterium]|nr:type II secretion system inner membrane protein GspF [Magnetococcales bacterium]